MKKLLLTIALFLPISVFAVEVAVSVSDVQQTMKECHVEKPENCELHYYCWRDEQPEKRYERKLTSPKLVINMNYDQKLSCQLRLKNSTAVGPRSKIVSMILKRGKPSKPSIGLLILKLKDG